LLKIVFERLKVYRASIFLREYSFWINLLIVSLNGNVQCFSYLLTFEINSLFSRKWSQKLMGLFALVVFFVLVFLCSFLFFYTRRKYRKLNKYFMDNANPGLRGAVFMLVWFSLRNIGLGVFHFLFESNYYTKLACIFTF